MFDIVQSLYEKICDIFKQGYDGFMGHEFEGRIKRAISVLHFKYLLGACKEANAVLPKTDLNNLNLFDLIISIYNKDVEPIRPNFSYCTVLRADFVAL